MKVLLGKKDGSDEELLEQFIQEKKRKNSSQLQRQDSDIFFNWKKKITLDGRTYLLDLHNPHDLNTIYDKGTSTNHLDEVTNATFS